MAVVLYIKWAMSGDIIDHKIIEVSEGEKAKLIQRHSGGTMPKYVDVKNAFRYGLEVEAKPVTKKVVADPELAEEVKAIVEDKQELVKEEKPVKKVILAKSEIK